MTNNSKFFKLMTRLVDFHPVMGFISQ